MQSNQIQNQNPPVYHHIKGTVCLIGYGSIGKGITPLIKRHFTYDRFVILDPVEAPKEGVCDQYYQVALTKENYVKVLDDIFDGKKGFFVNLSTGVCSRQMTEYCQSREIFYIDTVKQVWKGFFSDPNFSLSVRSNYGIRHNFNQYFKSKNYKTTAISCCGANPGMVSWFVKQALINIARDTGYKLEHQPKSRADWALLMKNLGVKGVHVAERDTQKTNLIRPVGQFWNTWSIQGLLSEGFQQVAQMGWGTHQKWMPHDARHHEFGSKSAIYLLKPGIYTMIKSWCPTPGPQIAMMVTHDESISIAEYYTVKQNNEVVYRPSVNYAYQPSEVTMDSCADLYGTGFIPPKEKWRILTEDVITEGIDQLGVLIYGHQKNAYWYGSQLSTEDTRKIAPNQNATGLQVSSAVLAAMVWTIQNPEAGLIQANETDYKRCLQVQRTYIEPIIGVYTNWNPLQNRSHTFMQDFDEEDPWQFKNILLHK